MAKKQILEIVDEVEAMFVKEGLNAKEMLMVLRELENNATVALVVSSLVNLNEHNKTDDNSGPGKT